MKRTRRGFTLIEILVVIAIIGILLAMLLVAYRAIFQTAHDATCRNNLRSLGQGLQTYASLDLWHKLPPGEDGNGGTFYDYLFNAGIEKVASSPALVSERLSCPLATSPRYNFKMNAALTDTSTAKPYSGKAEYLLRSNLNLVILFEGVPNDGKFTDRGTKEAAIQCRHLRAPAGGAFTRANIFYWGGQVQTKTPADTRVLTDGKDRWDF